MGYPCQNCSIQGTESRLTAGRRYRFDSDAGPEDWLVNYGVVDLFSVVRGLDSSRGPYRARCARTMWLQQLKSASTSFSEQSLRCQVFSEKALWNSNTRGERKQPNHGMDLPRLADELRQGTRTRRASVNIRRNTFRRSYPIAYYLTASAEAPDQRVPRRPQ